MVSFEFGVAFSPPSSTQASNLVKKGDMLVAVDVGKLPWTPETDWGTTKFKADICGGKEWGESGGVACGVQPSTGQLNITIDGVYDLYYVKYNGKSEFGVDKGYGKDFMKLSQQLCISANVSQCSAEQIANASYINKKIQDQLVDSIANDTLRKTEIQKKAAKDIAIKKEAAITANNSNRIVPINIELVGFGSEYVGKEEKSALEDGEKS
jgi:hypothetical protein